MILLIYELYTQIIRIIFMNKSLNIKQVWRILTKILFFYMLKDHIKKVIKY